MKLSLLTNKYFWFNLKYSISAFFNPRQKWLTKKIPNTWMDKTELIRVLLFECLIHYVEQEDGLDRMHLLKDDLKKGYIDQAYYDIDLLREKELLAAYKHIKVRDQLEREAFDAYPKCRQDDIFVKDENCKLGSYYMKSCEELYGCSFEEAYGKCMQLENELEEKDEKALQTILKYRSYLWT
jgi:hypothetical protein